MSKRNSMTEIKNGKVVFSKEILNYFENLKQKKIRNGLINILMFY